MDKEYIIRSFGKMPEAAIRLAIENESLFHAVFSAGRRSQRRRDQRRKLARA
jgi:hypothetical protein